MELLNTNALLPPHLMKPHSRSKNTFGKPPKKGETPIHYQVQRGGTGGVKIIELDLPQPRKEIEADLTKDKGKAIITEFDHLDHELEITPCILEDVPMATLRDFLTLRGPHCFLVSFSLTTPKLISSALVLCWLLSLYASFPL